MDGSLETEDICAFLSERGLDQQKLDEIIENKIDCSTLLSLTDTQLREFIPKLGDINAAKKFCDEYIKKKHQKSRSQSLIKRFKKKTRTAMGLKNIESDSESSNSEEHNRSDRRRQKLKGNTNAKKIDRQIELGWFNFESSDNSYHQVKTNKGGGTRNVKALKTWLPNDIIEHGKKLFFPKGKSKKGKVIEFEFQLRDFTEQPIPAQTSVGQMYEETDIKILRYYLFTKKIESSSKDETGTCKSSATSEDDTSLKSFSISPENSPIGNPVVMTSNINIDPIFETQIVNLVSTSNMPSTSTSSRLNLMVDSDIVFKMNDSTLLAPFNFEQGTLAQNQLVFDENDTLPLNYDPEMFTDNMLHLQNVEDSYNAGNVKIIQFHQGNCFEEMLKYYSKDTFKISSNLQRCKVERLLPNGDIEKGEGIGLIRDIFSEFWESFYKKCDGDEVKIPVLRHDMGEKEWKAIGRVIVNGYEELEYFPVKFAKPFLEDAVLGKSSSDLIESFLYFIPPMERTTVKTALENFDDVDQDELLDVMSSHDCKKIPNAENIKVLVSEIAHKEILQEPKFVIECWKPILKQMNLTVDLLQNIIILKRPTVQKVLKLLEFPETLDMEQQITVNNLKRFVKNLDQKQLEAFVRFCTGSNQIGEKIKVNFSKLDKLERRPTAQTCGCVLTVPTTYENFGDMREEFFNILASNVWEMGFV